MPVVPSYGGSSGEEYSFLRPQSFAPSQTGFTPGLRPTFLQPQQQLGPSLLGQTAPSRFGGLGLFGGTHPWAQSYGRQPVRNAGAGDYSARLWRQWSLLMGSPPWV
jgi:hypothetical protein